MRCKEEADRFYNAYVILRENNQAVCETGNFQRITMGVDIVCLAFSLELYLKNLHFLCGNSSKGHNILKLFDALPEEVKCGIYEADLKSVSFYSLEGYRKQIELISDGFVKWRYAYERASISYNSSLAISLIDAIKKVSTLKEGELYSGAIFQKLR